MSPNTFKMMAMAVLLALGACSSTPPKPYLVFFLSDDGALTPEAQKIVTEIAAQAVAARPSRILVEGYADGATAQETVLAQARADSVAQALVKAGVDGALIQRHAGAPEGGQQGVAARKVQVTVVP
jgi:outer membrane protein OmpA-like peptidoglycan-associated protein